MSVYKKMIDVGLPKIPFCLCLKLLKAMLGAVFSEMTKGLQQLLSLIKFAAGIIISTLYYLAESIFKVHYPQVPKVRYLGSKKKMFSMFQVTFFSNALCYI
jgi:hypothetical protein